jgi:hypothetical protein
MACTIKEENPIRYILAISILLMAHNSLCHVPIISGHDSSVGRPFQLNRPYNQSIAVYTHFDAPNDMDVYEFALTPKDIERGAAEILIGTLVPACAPLADLLISWVLIGPKQVALGDTLETSHRNLLDLKGDHGTFYTTNSVQGEVWEEPYTSHYYFRQARKKIKLTEVGNYRVYVWSPNEKQGDYVFEFGDDEIWPVKDILYTLWVLPKLWLEGEIVTKDCVTSAMRSSPTPLEQ